MSEREIGPDEALILRCEECDLPAGEDRMQAFLETLTQMGYATRPTDQWYNPDAGGQEFALAFPGIGDRAGEFALLHCGPAGIHLHRLPDREALELRARELPDIAAAMRKHQGPLAAHLAQGVAFVGFYRPKAPADPRQKARARRRMAARSRRKNR